MSLPMEWGRGDDVSSSLVCITWAYWLLCLLSGHQLDLRIPLHDIPAILMPHDNAQTYLSWQTSFVLSYHNLWNSSRNETDCPRGTLEGVKCLSRQNFFGKKLTPHHDLVMRIMRLSVALGNAMITAEDFNTMLGDLEYMNFTRKDAYAAPVSDPTSMTRSPLGSLLPETQWQKDSAQLELLLDCQSPHISGANKNCREHFAHVPTHRGICSVFNAGKMAAVMKTDASPWMRSFQRCTMS